MPDPHEAAYDQPTKVKARQHALKHAVQLVTSRRDAAAIVPADHPKRVRDYLLKSKTGQDQAVARACASEDIDSWCSFRASTVGVRTPSEITVAYLAGPEPQNDLEVLLELGVRPENIWAFEVDKKAAAVGLKILQSLRARGIKFIPVSIEDFFIGTPRRFDIIYFDACGAFPSKDSNTARVLATMFRHSALAPLGVLVSNFARPDISRPEDLARYSFLVGAYLYPKSFLESKRGGSVEGPPVHGFTFNRPLESDDDPSEDFIEEVKSNFEHYYGLFITRSLMDLSTIVAPMCRLLGGDIWKIAFKDDLKAAIARGKRLVVINQEAFAIDEDEEDVDEDGPDTQCNSVSTEDGIGALEGHGARTMDSDGDAVMDPDFFTLIWTLAACGSYSSDNEFQPIPDNAKSLIKTWRNSLVGKKAGNLTLEDVVAIYYAWRHDQSLWAPAMQRIGEFSFQEKMPFLCDVPTEEIGFYPAFAQLAYPAHPNVREAKRFRYVAEGKTTPMFMDVIAFDECRYVHDWISAMHLTPDDWEDLSTQLTFRFALDGIAKEKRWMGDDFLYGCHVVGECKEFQMSDLEPRVDLSSHA